LLHLLLLLVRHPGWHQQLRFPATAAAAAAAAAALSAQQLLQLHQDLRLLVQ
jgi:hypothetical protein